MILRRTVWMVALAVSLVACAGPSRQKAETPEPPPAAARVPAPPVPAPAPAPEPPRQADTLARIASELVELQNAVAKLMMSTRQHDEQMLFLQRRLTELESQARRGGPVAPVPPSVSMPMPSPLPPAPVTAGSIPASPSAAPAPNPPALARATPSPGLNAPPPGVAPPASAAEELYRAGLEKYQAGDLDGAVVTLYEVVANFPTDPAREASQLLVGEIFLAQKDYRGAIAEFEGLISAAPRGIRVPDALLKIGLAQRSLGEEGRARRSWERLVKDYPTSAAARQARTLLKGRG